VSDSADPQLQSLLSLIYQVKPSLPAESVTPDDRLIDDLALDSLDLLQLARKIVRTLRVDFDLEAWEEGRSEHGGTVRSLLRG
jgi:acyl carrier protein